MMNLLFLLFIITILLYKSIVPMYPNTHLTPIVNYNSCNSFYHRIDHQEYLGTFFIVAIQFHIYIRFKIILQIK